MQLFTKDGKMHLIVNPFSFEELLREYMGADTADAFNDYMIGAVMSAEAKKSDENLDDLCRYVLRVLLPGIAKEIRRFRNHPDVDDRLSKWQEEFKGKVEDIYGLCE